MNKVYYKAKGTASSIDFPKEHGLIKQRAGDELLRGADVFLSSPQTPAQLRTTFLSDCYNFAW